MSERNNALGEFLRARRESLSPTDVGLPDRGRRRTPGLRREEVATLAGVSVDYLTRLEQGRDSHPSAEVVNALASALRMTRDERLHLSKLAMLPHVQPMCPQPAELRPSVRALLDRLDPTPAFVTDRVANVLAWNTTWGALAEPLGCLDGDQPNLARYVFVHPSARTVYDDWSTAADAEAGRLRVAAALQPDDPALVELVAELQSLPEFARRWDAYTLHEKLAGTKDLRHPALGLLRIEYQLLWVADTDQGITTWLPGDERTAAAFDSLVAERLESPARLRLVGGE